MRPFALLMLAVAVAVAAELPNRTRSEPLGSVLAGPIHPQMGRAAIVGYHGGRIIVVPERPGSQAGADCLVRVIDLGDLANPQVTVHPFRASGFNAHGYFQSGSFFYSGPFGADGRFFDGFRITDDGGLAYGNVEDADGLHVASYNRSGAHAPWGANMWWSYAAPAGDAWLSLQRSPTERVYLPGDDGVPTGPGVRARWNHLGTTGVVAQPLIFGNLLIYAGDQSGTGIATYDISDPTSPRLLDVLKDGDPGGYWPEIWGHYVVFPHRLNEGGAAGKAGFSVVDFRDPEDLRLVVNRTLAEGNQYVTFQDEFAFTNRYKIDLRTFEVALELQTNDGTLNTLDASQFALPVGNLVVTGGYGSSGPGIAVWAHQTAPDTRGPWVAYHLPRPDAVGVSTVTPISFSIPETLRTETIISGTSLIVRPVGGSPVPVWHSFSQGKVLTVTPHAPLAADTTYEVLLTADIQDAAHNAMEPYQFRFSTGASLGGGNQPPVITGLSASASPVTPGTPVTITAAASDPEAGALEYRFDAGDGSPRTAWSSSPSTVVRYGSSGHPQVLVQVRDAEGALSSRTLGLAIAPDPTGTATGHSATVVQDNARTYLVNPDSGTVAAVDRIARTIAWEVPVGSDPRSLALGGDGSLWVAVRGSDAVVVLDAATGTETARLALGYGSAPVGLCRTTDGLFVLVACSGDGTLRRHVLGDRSESGRVVLGPTPRAIATIGTRALVTRFISGPEEASVYDVDLVAFALTRTIPIPRINISDGSANGRGIANYLASIVIEPDGDRAWVAAVKANTDRGTLVDVSQALGHDSTVRACLVAIDLATNTVDPAFRVDIDNSDSPTALAFSPRSDYLFVTLQGNAQVVAYDLLDLERSDTAGTLLARFPVGRAPQGVLLGDDGLLWTQDFLGRSTTVLDATPLLTQGSLTLSAQAITTQGREPLAAEVLAGKRMFYHADDARMSAEGYISCASCHVDGGHDGRTWDFTGRGEGLRNTTDLRGRSGTGHGRVHWSANFDEIQDFENDMRAAFGGRGFLSEADFAATGDPLGPTKAGRSTELDALAAYVASLDRTHLPRSPDRSADGGRSPAAERGATVFSAQDCASCHAPERGFTDRSLHDIGTRRASSGQRLGGLLPGIETPTLLGLHAGAPYLHDGSATTLDEVFSRQGGTTWSDTVATLLGSATRDASTTDPIQTMRGASSALLNDDGEGLRFTGIDGGPSGGPATIEVRYATRYSNASARILVNGAGDAHAFPRLLQDPGWIPIQWRVLTLPVTLRAGIGNQVEIHRISGTLSIDEILVATPADRAKAAPHRRVLDLPAGDQADLLAYLRELDGREAPMGPDPGGSPGPGAPPAIAPVTTGTAPAASTGTGGGGGGGCGLGGGFAALLGLLAWRRRKTQGNRGIPADRKDSTPALRPGCWWRNRR